MASEPSPEEAIVAGSRARPSRKQASLFPADEYASALQVGRQAVFTIGHSTRKLAELISVLRHYRIARLVDIRHFPASRHNPQFNKAVLEVELPPEGIEYHWLERLGGYRHGGYLAHMETDDFKAGLAELERLAREKSTAYMCAELVWFKCHRRRVSDALSDRGWHVIHIFDENRAQQHRMKNNRIKCD